MKSRKNTLSLMMLGMLSSTSFACAAEQSAAETASEIQQCVMDAVLKAKDNQTVGEIRERCSQSLAKEISSVEAKAQDPSPVLIQRLVEEKRTSFDPYVITPHMINYMLPALTTNQINAEAYDDIEGFSENFTDVETKFQLSLKVPLNKNDLFFEDDALYFAFTIEAWWQVYSDNISKPFRETNYKPEVFYTAPMAWRPFDMNTAFVVGMEHQSNGRSQLLSRSWNRVYTHLLFAKDDFLVSFKPWWRIEEDEKEFPFDPDGDDNPDIEDFMGHFELAMAYKWDDYELNFKGRRNFSTHKGGVELGLTFPIWGKLRGYALVFNGYGESLIDYNHKQTRFGIGLALNNIL